VCARATAGSWPAPAGAGSFNGSLAHAAGCPHSATKQRLSRLHTANILLLLECGLKSLPRVDGNLTSLHAMVLRSPTAKVGSFAGTRQRELLVSQRWVVEDNQSHHKMMPALSIQEVRSRFANL
jgi:hypothetical protein